MTGLEALCAGLSDLGVRHVFGLPGTQNADFFNSLPEQGIRPVLATHESSASFMANGYARASGRVGVLATIPGPGFTFALPGIAEARLDSVPLIHLVGAPARGARRFLHQAIDQAGVAGPLVKAIIQVDTAEEVVSRLREAHRLALSGEPGPVLLHLDRDALRGPAPEDVSAPEQTQRATLEASPPPWAEELRQLVAASERPVIFLGAGALDSPSAVSRLVESLPAPTFTTLTARGALPEDHPCSMAFDADRGGLDELNALLERSDLILALGCKFSHNGTAGFGMRLPKERLVHVNTDAEALESSYPARLQIQAAVDDALPLMLEASRVAPRTSWTADEISALKSRFGQPRPPRIPEPRFQGIAGGSAEHFFGALRQALPRDAIVVTDSGLHQVMTRRYFEVRSPRGLITPSDFQSMGFGLPAAIGAALAAPSRPVVAIVGDGGFLMTAMDLACAVREAVPMVVIVFNDGYLNLIRLQQLQDEGMSTAVQLRTPDLEALSASMGIRYGRLEAAPESMIREALDAPAPMLLEVCLGDSSGIRAMRIASLARRSARRALGGTLLDHLKNLRGLVRHHQHR